jgi:hypothetical protein
LTGDKKYGGVFRQNGYFLYAYKIVIEKDGGTLTVELKMDHDHILDTARFTPLILHL